VPLAQAMRLLGVRVGSLLKADEVSAMEQGRAGAAMHDTTGQLF
jgi:hypothetical protein